MKAFLKTLCLTLCLMMACGCLCLCSAEEAEAEPEAVPVIMVDDIMIDQEAFHNAIALRAYDMNYAAYLNYNTNMNISVSQAAYDVTWELIRNALVDRKLEETGLFMLTEEEENAARESASENFYQYNMYATYYYQMPVSVLSYVIMGEDLSGEDDFVASALRTTRENKLWNSMTQDMTITAEDEELVLSTYNENVEADKAAYATAADFASAWNSGTVSTVYWAPEGARYVKQVLISFTDEDNTLISEAQSAVSAAGSALTSANSALQAEETEETKAAAEAARTAAEEAQAHLDEVMAAAFEHILPTAQDVAARAKAGEDFDALIAAFGSDPGMTREPFSVTGYAVSEGYAEFDSVFVNAAMALAQPGDVSEPAQSEMYGYYVIRFESEVPAGERALEEVRDDVEANALINKKNLFVNETLSSWFRDADIRLLPEYFFN